MHRVEYHRLFAADLRAAYQWYEEQRPGLGEDFLLCVEAAVAQIGKMPKRGRPIIANVRRVFIGRFPYQIHYRYYDDRVSILSVRHVRRKPLMRFRRD